MSKSVRARSAHTWFKPGHKPAGTLYNGAITIRKDKRGVPQKFIRIRKMKWEHLSRYTWRKAHGRIPKGMLVAFVNGDTMNCDISNLMLISRADNAMRNRLTQWPPEVREVIKLNNKLKKAIKDAKKQN